MEKLTSSQIESRLLTLDSWTVNNGELSNSYKLKSFMDVMSFANLVADKSEQIKHHPKIIIDYSKIQFALVTHDIGGLSKLDIQLAKFINETCNELFV